MHDTVQRELSLLESEKEQAAVVRLRAQSSADEMSPSVVGLQRLRRDCNKVGAGMARENAGLEERVDVGANLRNR